jgi:hypothetical protein
MAETPQRTARWIVFVTARAVAIYAFAGFVYIAANAISHPYTLTLRLTHFVSWPDEDLFGATCFVASAVAHFVQQLTRPR